MGGEPGRGSALGRRSSGPQVLREEEGSRNQEVREAGAQSVVSKVCGHDPQGTGQPLARFKMGREGRHDGATDGQTHTDRCFKDRWPGRR